MADAEDTTTTTTAVEAPPVAVMSGPSSRLVKGLGAGGVAFLIASWIVDHYHLPVSTVQAITGGVFIVITALVGWLVHERSVIGVKSAAVVTSTLGKIAPGVAADVNKRIDAALDAADTWLEQFAADDAEIAGQEAAPAEPVPDVDDSDDPTSPPVAAAGKA